MTNGVRDAMNAATEALKATPHTNYGPLGVPLASQDPRVVPAAEANATEIERQQALAQERRDEAQAPAAAQEARLRSDRSALDSEREAEAGEIAASTGGGQ
jgi:hypothetical protein